MRQIHCMPSYKNKHFCRKNASDKNLVMILWKWVNKRPETVQSFCNTTSLQKLTLAQKFRKFQNDASQKPEKFVNRSPSNVDRDEPFSVCLQPCPISLPIPQFVLSRLYSSVSLTVVFGLGWAHTARNIYVLLCACSYVRRAKGVGLLSMGVQPIHRAAPTSTLCPFLAALRGILIGIGP